MCTTTPQRITTPFPPHTHIPQQQDNNRIPAWSKLAAALPRKLLAPMTLAFATWQGMAGFQLHSPGSGLPLGTWGWGRFGWAGGKAYRITHIHTPLSTNPHDTVEPVAQVAQAARPSNAPTSAGSRVNKDAESLLRCVFWVVWGGLWGVRCCWLDVSNQGSSDPSIHWFVLLWWGRGG
jgi:hypothetical protein